MNTPQTLDYSGPKTTKPQRSKGRWLRALLFLLLSLLATAIFLALTTPQYGGGGDHERAKFNTTRASINMIKQALNTFEVDHDRFPTTTEGLDALVHQPKGMSDWHPYLEKIPTDAWGGKFEYRCPSTTGAPFYDLYSFGPDSQDGTPDDLYEDR